MKSRNSHTPARSSSEKALRGYLGAILASSRDAVIGLTSSGRITEWNRAAAKLFGHTPQSVRGRPVSILLPRGRRKEFARLLDKARSHRAVVHVETVVVGKNGRPIDVLLSASGVRGADGTAPAVVLLVRDITRRKIGVGTRLLQNRELLTLHRISEIILSSRPVEESYGDIAREIAAATGFPFAAIALYDPARETIVFRGATGPGGRNRGRTIEVPLDRTLSTIVIRTGKPFLEAHVRRHPQYRRRLRRLGGIQTFVGYPMKAGQKVIGCLSLAHTESVSLSNETSRWIESLTNYVTELTERKRAEEELRASREQLRELSTHLQKGIEEERRRIAREIHDELGQALSLLQLELGLLREHGPGTVADLRRKTGQMVGLVDDTIRTVQRISTDLRPTLLDDLGLGAAVEWAAREFQKRTRVRCRLVVEPLDLTLDPDRSTALFRILQETFTNILRHARASRVNVRLVKREDAVVMRVRDNGVGIRPDRVTDSGSLGLIGMRERVHPWGGGVAIAGRPGKGTEITVTLPLEP